MKVWLVILFLTRKALPANQKKLASVQFNFTRTGHLTNLNGGYCSVCLLLAHPGHSFFAAVQFKILDTAPFLSFLNSFYKVTRLEIGRANFCGMCNLFNTKSHVQ